MTEPTTYTHDEALRAALTDWARTYGFGGRAFISGTYTEVADALLPVVRAYANQRAAEELRDAAAQIRRTCRVWPTGYDLAADLEARAAALHPRDDS